MVVGSTSGPRTVVSTSRRTASVPEGRIKKIIPDRGFGFVRADDGNEVFFHRTELTAVDFDTLQDRALARDPFSANIPARVHSCAPLW